MFLVILCGFLMALADSVPGVSGGTIAFVLGFYDKFIGSLNTLTSKKTSKDEKKEAVKFLKDNDVFSLPTDEALATLKNCPLNSIIIKITDAIEKDNTTVKEAAEGELKKQIEDLKKAVAHSQSVLANGSKFMSEVLGDSPELKIFSTDITRNDLSAQFLIGFGCDEFSEITKTGKSNKELLSELDKIL